MPPDWVLHLNLGWQQNSNFYMKNSSNHRDLFEGKYKSYTYFLAPRVVTFFNTKNVTNITWKKVKTSLPFSNSTQKIPDLDFLVSKNSNSSTLDNWRNIFKNFKIWNIQSNLKKTKKNKQQQKKRCRNFWERI